MVKAVREGQGLRAAARTFNVSHATVKMWVARAKGRRLECVDFGDRPSGPREPANRTPKALEARVVRLRRSLKSSSALGEHGASAILRTLRECSAGAVPCERTITRILERNGQLDGRQRSRFPAPPKGWYLPPVACNQVELDSFDVVEDLKIAGGSMFSVLTGVSLLGGMVAAWPAVAISAKFIVERLPEHWRRHGLPGYAQFDNDTRFQGTHRVAGVFGRVVRMCLQAGVTPVFAPPRETGFQASVESHNGKWQRNVWDRFEYRRLSEVVRRSERYVEAHRARNGARIEGAPARGRLAGGFEVNLSKPLSGRVIYIRRTNGEGVVNVVGKLHATRTDWQHRLVRCEVDFDEERLRIYALRRKAPETQPLLKEYSWKRPVKAFLGD